MNIFLDGNNDIAMVDGGLLLITGIEETRQLLQQTLSFFQADWFLDLNLGLPYFQTILQKATSISAVEGIYLDTIAAVPGVLDIETFNLAFDKTTRRADVTFRVVTSNGILDFSTLNSEA
jgi:hypothetical protein